VNMRLSNNILRNNLAREIMKNSSLSYRRNNNQNKEINLLTN
jgi:hypothetical protein